MAYSSRDLDFMAQYLQQTHGGEFDDALAEVRRLHGLGDVDMAALITKLGGEDGGEDKSGRKIVFCPSPGFPADDRSCHIRFDGSKRPFIYDCEGPVAAAYAMVRAALGSPEDRRHDAVTNSARALRILSETLPAPGTAVERYLRSRAITLPPPAALRFHPALYHGPSRRTWPAMVAAVTRADGTPIAIHRTYLRPDGQGKARVESNKMSLGPIGGCAIRLAPLAEELMIGEGIETCLSVMQETGQSAWSAISAIGLRQLNLPAEVSRVTILADGDATGEAAARAAAARWVAEGRQVWIARPPTGKDFNDSLLAGAAR